MTHVPFVDLRAQSRELRDEVHEVFESVLSRAAHGAELWTYDAPFRGLPEVRFVEAPAGGVEAGRR